ncbi:hypothetical protein QAD02_009139 [Eretmocerus hayati]|uniref:Uncharacterized protein n=1 Tax=Eretmocerus hayati TaxID=131215 RepID=A0ACC2N8U4_9HYME|nr:hypothetical protein QAD02_009139 [Eretmocerus hayati]
MATRSFTSLSVKDGNCGSTTALLLRGKWLVSSLDLSTERRFITFFMDILSLGDPDLVKEWKVGCNKPLHHRPIVLSPAHLHELGIPFQPTILSPGDLIRFGARSLYMLYLLDSLISVSTDIGGHPVGQSRVLCT